MSIAAHGGPCRRQARRAPHWRIALALLLAVVAWLALPLAAHAQTAVPALTARVIDQTGTLDAAQRQALDDKLAAFETRKGTQLVVLMVSSTAPEDIASYAQRVADSWKIGRKNVGDGLLVVVAKDDRKMRIEVAKALEGAVPDLRAVRIIDEAMKPAFRRNDFAGGLDAALDRLMAAIETEGLPEVEVRDASRGTAKGGFELQDLAIFLFFAVV
ncbi:MAG: YgcG family protein, partial [Comamonadaceae bacterium]